ncbi:histone deacetylase family protein [Ideonella livida]|uniref:Histone deacetylase family protein n=1 Tax=Ideonella livida TaxID=2707176 RepID=A0A7C9TM39_9BURK|nr:histone deacetylase family protein [Ideonella livida]NDY93781.1 histone deacetylase family protein [Ideonella livida]
MLTLHSPRHALHHGTELKDGTIKPSFEHPQRADTILAQVRAAGLGELRTEQPHDRAALVAAHSERYVQFLETAWARWTATGRQHDALPLVWPVREGGQAPEPEHIDGQLGFYAMDAGAPINGGTWPAVQASAHVALTALDAVASGEQRAAFALCRPPGHHAGPEYAGGYCYLNNAAIAAQHARTLGVGRVAVLDVDFHHGNGTQAIFYRRPDVFFASLHGDPLRSYPYFWGHADETGAGEGLGANANYPLPHGTDWAAYSPVLTQALARIRAHGAELLVVSLGVDTFEHDPISHFRLRTADYLRLGQQIASAGLPTVFVMEGGYLVDDIGRNVVNVLRGFEDA